MNAAGVTLPPVQTARQYFDHALTEREFQQAVVNLAKLCGWRIYHTYRSDHSPAGFPDLVLVRGTQLVFAELKKERGRATPEQQGWLEALRGVGQVCHDCGGDFVRTFLWKPSDWEEIETVLTERYP